MNEGSAVTRAANGTQRPPRRALEAFDALALHDRLAADPLDGTGIQLALEWEWERAEYGIPEGIAREELVALTGDPAPTKPPGEVGGRERNEKAHGGDHAEQEEAA